MLKFREKGEEEAESKTRRPRTEIFQAISTFIIESETPFNKSTLKDVDVNPETAENYVKCFEIAQNTPRIIIMRTGKRTSIGKETYPAASEKKKPAYETKRTMVEIFQDVSTYIINASEAFYKSNLRDIGLDAKTGGMYIDCFEIAQKTPRIRVQRTGNSTVIGKEEHFMVF